MLFSRKRHYEREWKTLTQELMKNDTVDIQAAVINSIANFVYEFSGFYQRINEYPLLPGSDAETMLIKQIFKETASLIKHLRRISREMRSWRITPWSSVYQGLQSLLEAEHLAIIWSNSRLLMTISEQKTDGGERKFLDLLNNCEELAGELASFGNTCKWLADYKLSTHL